MNIFKKNRPGPPAPLPLEYVEMGDEISVEGALCQTAQAIDIVAIMATEDRDTARLLEAAEAWKSLADFIVALSEHQVKQEKKKTDIPIGFQSKTADQADKNEITVEEEELVRNESDGTDQDSGSDGVHPEHGEFRVNENRRGGRRLSPRRRVRYGIV
jgi:hypothetical protein